MLEQSSSITDIVRFLLPYQMVSCTAFAGFYLLLLIFYSSGISLSKEEQVFDSFKNEYFLYSTLYEKNSFREVNAKITVKSDASYSCITEFLILAEREL